MKTKEPLRRNTESVPKAMTLTPTKIKRKQTSVKNQSPSLEKQVVHFRSLEKPKEDSFCLMLSKNHSYHDVVERVACRINLDDLSRISLTSHNCYTRQPKTQPANYRGAVHLFDMLIDRNRMSDILYYEVMSIKNLKVLFHHATKDEPVFHNIMLQTQSRVRDVLNELKTKVELSHPNAELRLLKVLHHKIYKIFPSNEKIENINDQYWTLRAEEIPEEEKNLGPHDRLIHVYHFTKESAQNQQVQNFGEPFFLVIHEGEMLAEIKLRIQKKLQVPDEEFAEWKFAFLSLGRPEYLEDGDVLSTRFQRKDVYGDWAQYLGLEHSDNTLKKRVLFPSSIPAKQQSSNETSRKKQKSDSCFVEMAMSLLQKIEDDKAPCSVKISDFKDIASNNYVTVGIFTVPESLRSYATDLLADRPDLGTGNSPVHYLNEMAFVVLCCVLKSMDTKRSSEITESLILKWGDAIRGALLSGFKVDFLKDRLKSITLAFLASFARNSQDGEELQAVTEKITAMENSLKALRVEMTK